MTSFEIIFTVLLLATCCQAFGKLSSVEREVIAECLESYGGLSGDNAARLQRYKEWSDTYEEIPCFTNCYLSKMFDFYNETSGFRNELIIQQFGQPLYNACKHRLAHGQNSCEKAYSGFHCIVTLENDPFIAIDNMKNLHNDAKHAMKECLYKFDAFEWDRIKDYANFSVREPIPCYTKCFIEKLQIYNKNTRQWQINEMRAMLGVPVYRADIDTCIGMYKRRNRNACAWMYQEFTCFVLAKESQ